MKEIVIKWGIQMESFTPNITSPNPQSSKNWFGLVNNCKNLLNQIEKNSLEMPFSLVCQKDFGTDCRCICNRTDSKWISLWMYVILTLVSKVFLNI